MGGSPGPGRWFTTAVAVGGLIATLAGVAGLDGAGTHAAENMGPLDNVPRALAGEDSQAIAVQSASWAVKEGGSQAGRASAARPDSSLSEIAAPLAIESGGPPQPAMLQVTSVLRTGRTGRLALRVTILGWDRASVMEFAAESHVRATETSPLAASLLEAASGRTASLLDSASSADLDRLVAFLTAEKVLSPVLDQLVTAESGRPVTLIARGALSAHPPGGPAVTEAHSAPPGAQDLVVTCLPAVADRERIRLRVVAEIAVAGRSSLAGGAMRAGVPGGGIAMLLREGQTLVVAGLAEDAAEPQFLEALPFLAQALKGKTSARGTNGFAVLVTPRLAPPL